MTLRFGLLFLTLACTACFSDPPTPQRVSGESAGSSTGGDGDPSTGEDPSSTSVAESSSSGGLRVGCADAFDARSCSMASDPEFEECSWYPTFSHDVASCEPWATDGGACVIEQGLDGCSEPEPTCPEGGSWSYRVGADGSVEVINTSNLCYGLSEFTPCPWASETSSSTSVGSTTVATSDSVGSTGGETGDAETGASYSSVGGTSGGGGWTLQEEIEAVCACACA